MFIHLWNLNIPVYGFLITFGGILANLLAIWFLRKYKFDVNDFIILEAYTLLGAFLGAKGLYLIVSIHLIDWSRIFEVKYFSQIMQGGFVFYGGLIGGLTFLILAGKLHHIAVRQYITHFIWLIPLVHGFGRVGCHVVGCCYGIPYHGPFAITYGNGFFAPEAVPRFPVQLIEAIGLFLISICLLLLILRGKEKYSLEIYLASYSIFRFVLEFFRADSDRGKFLWFSTSQWICLLILLSLPFFIRRKEHK